LKPHKWQISQNDQTMKKNSKCPTQKKKKTHFPAPPILNIFTQKFHGLVLGLVGLIDAKGIDMAQRIWP
jgi:hypothetical protein